jgi:hypothetical protein
MKYAAENIVDIDVGARGDITITYSKADEKRSFKATTGELSTNPLRRIPLFNILKTNSPLKKFMEGYLKSYLGWDITFFDNYHIDIDEEARKWRMNLRLSASSEISAGTRAQAY